MRVATERNFFSTRSNIWDGGAYESFLLSPSDPSTPTGYAHLQPQADASASCIGSNPATAWLATLHMAESEVRLMLGPLCI